MISTRIGCPWIMGQNNTLSLGSGVVVVEARYDVSSCDSYVVGTAVTWYDSYGECAFPWPQPQMPIACRYV